MKTGNRAMVTRTALRQAIADLERLATGGEGSNVAASPVLARLYTTYAQITLETYGINVDLPALCGDHIAYGLAPSSTRH